MNVLRARIVRNVHGINMPIYYRAVCKLREYQSSDPK